MKPHLEDPGEPCIAILNLLSQGREEDALHLADATGYTVRRLPPSADGTLGEGVAVLLTDQTDAAANGIYTLTAIGSAGAPFTLDRGPAPPATRRVGRRRRDRVRPRGRS